MAAERVDVRKPERNTGSKQASVGIVAFLSGKGGVGKTTLSLNVALALARRGQRVTLVSACDAAQPITSLIQPAILEKLGARLPITFHSLDGVPESWPHQIALLSAPDAAVLVDCPSGIGPELVAACRAASRLLLISTCEPASIAGAYAALKYVRSAGCAASADVVLNIVRRRRDADLAARRLSGAAQRFLDCPLPTLACVVEDRHAALAARERIPLIMRYPRASASHGITLLADRLAARPANLSHPLAGSSVWSSLATLFL